MKNNDIIIIDNLVTNLVNQVKPLFSLDSQELRDYSTLLTKTLIDTQVNTNCLGVSGMIYITDSGTTYYSFLFKVPDTTSGSADALVQFAMNFTDGETNIRSINRVAIDMMQITFLI